VRPGRTVVRHKSVRRGRNLRVFRIVRQLFGGEKPGAKFLSRARSATPLEIRPGRLRYFVWLFRRQRPEFPPARQCALISGARTRRKVKPKDDVGREQLMF
jgi:hypothetical protein